MPRKRKVFAHPKAILLKFEEKEFLAIEAALREERAKRPHLARTELLREWILAHVQKDEKILDDRPVPCRYCKRLVPQTRIREHEDQCAQNPKWGPNPKKLPPELEQLVDMRRWWDSRLEAVEARFTTKIEVLEQFLFRDRVWADLSPVEQARLLQFFLNPAVGAAPRQFRPVQFKAYLTRIGVQFEEVQIDSFLKQQVGSLLMKNDQSFYVGLK